MLASPSPSNISRRRTGVCVNCSKKRKRFLLKASWSTFKTASFKGEQRIRSGASRSVYLMSERGGQTASEPAFWSRLSAGVFCGSDRFMTREPSKLLRNPHVLWKTTQPSQRGITDTEQCTDNEVAHWARSRIQSCWFWSMSTVTVSLTVQRLGRQVFVSCCD